MAAVFNGSPIILTAVVTMVLGIVLPGAQSRRGRRTGGGVGVRRGLRRSRERFKRWGRGLGVKGVEYTFAKKYKGAPFC